MTRKRFVKKLMGCGISRNVAWHFVDLARARELSYADMYEMPITRLICSFARMGSNVKKVCKSLDNVARVTVSTLACSTELQRSQNEEKEIY